VEAHLALLPLHMGIIRTLAAEKTDHRLVKKMFRRMTRRKLFFIMLIQDIVVSHLFML